MSPAAELLCAELRRRGPKERVDFLKDLLAHTAAGLSLLEGEAAAGEAIYRLADAVVAGPTATPPPRPW